MRALSKSLLLLSYLFFSYALAAQDMPTLNIVIHNHTNETKEVLRVVIPFGKAGGKMLSKGDKIAPNASMTLQLEAEDKSGFRSLFVTFSPDCHIFISQEGKGNRPDVSFTEKCPGSVVKLNWNLNESQLDINL